eukprot:scaffold1954_cov268-Pinguiococcus_pyrenoidosus.AAC.157
MPVCFCVGAVAGVFMPASWPLWDWALKSYESFAIWKFAQLIVLICGGKGIMLTDLAEQSMRKYWAAPPCCCTAPCQDKQVFTERDYRRILRLIFQFVFLVPPLFFLQMLIFIFEADPKARLPLNAVGGISTIICMYGLATLYFAVHNLPAVQGHRLIQKFTVIKLMVLLSVLQVGAFARKLLTCVLEAHGAVFPRASSSIPPWNLAASTKDLRKKRSTRGASSSAFSSPSKLPSSCSLLSRRTLLPRSLSTR